MVNLPPNVIRRIVDHFLPCVLTGFASGLPLYTLLQLVPAWLQQEGVSLATIGALSLIQLPYTWKFLWAPVLDRWALWPRLGRRRGWILVLSLGVAAAIAGVGQVDPVASLPLVVTLLVAIAWGSATLDVVLDAYRRELLSDAELGFGNAVHVNAYRVAGLVPGSLALILAEDWPWPAVFAFTAAFLLPGVVLALWRVPLAHGEEAAPASLRAAVVEPFREFFHREGRVAALLTLAVVFAYKLGDALATALATPFYLAMGFSLSEVGLIAKHAALWPLIAGSLVGGIWMIRLGIVPALWWFGWAQAVTIFGYWALALLGAGPSDAVRLAALAAVIAAEYFAAGLGTTALVAFVAQRTHPAYAATQLALLTSLAAAPRSIVNAFSGVLVEALGWPHFFVLCFVLTLPGMALVGLLWRRAIVNGDRSTL
ncbi:AmpG family muropeptide MFS transporter [Hydrogenophilus thermoluteolus]|nr:AmpG family muropeptide MFS transporter [Hydrogenophilus thermoluteolus]